MINKNENKQENKPFGLYNPILMIKNNEVVSKNFIILNFIDNNLFDIVPQFNLSFFNLDLLLSKLGNIFNDENSKMNVNLRFALFVIYKRILMLKDYAHLLSFKYSYSEIEHLRSTINEKNKSKNEQEKENYLETADSLNTTDIVKKENKESTEDKLLDKIVEKENDKDSKSKSNQKQQNEDFHLKFINNKLTELYDKHQIIRKLCSISLDMFKNKIDSDNNEISNFFSYILKNYNDEVLKIFKEFNFDLREYIKFEEVSLILKNIPASLCEKTNIKQMNNVHEGFVNTTYITAGNKKDIIIYTPRNSILYFTCTITYYDALVNIYKYDASNEGSIDKFELLSKEQKIESDFTPFECTIFSYKPEIFKINIDNTYSWMNGKEIKYKYTILQLSDKTSPNELHKFNVRYKIDFFKENVLNKITEYIFFKYETFLGKHLEDFSKKILNYNQLNSYSSFWLQKFQITNQVKNSKEQISKLYSIFANKRYTYKEIKEQESKNKENEEKLDNEVDKENESKKDEDTNKEEKKTEDNENNKVIDINEEKNKNLKLKEIETKESELLIPESLTEICQYDTKPREKYVEYIKQAYSKVTGSMTTVQKTKKTFKLEKLGSLDVIIKSYIKNVFVRVNLNETELDDPTFKSEIGKFDDSNDQFIFFNYYYLRQNKECTLGNYFESETIDNSNIIFMKFPLVDCCLIYYLYSNLIEGNKFPDKIIYFHFDKSLEKYCFAIWSEGELLGDDSCFGEDDLITNEKDLEKVIIKFIDDINFKKAILIEKKNKKMKKNKKNKKDNSDSEENSSSSEEESEDEEESSDEDEKKDKLKNWKVVCSFTGNNKFVEESKNKIKIIVGNVNKHYVKEGKTKKEKKIKTVFKSVDFVCEMTNFMHCLELY